MSLWLQCVAYLQESLPFAEFSMWIRPLQAEWNGERLALYAPNHFVQHWVRDHYLGLIEAFFEKNGVPSVQLSFTVGSCSAETPPPEPPPCEDLVYTTLHSKYQFKNFVEGEANQLALASARQVAQHLGAHYNPLLLYGGTGLGKTHLLHAIGNAVEARTREAKVIYIHAERFVQQMVSAMQRQSMEAFKQDFRSADLLLIDDLQFFVKKERSQQELLLTLNVLLESGRQVVFAADRYPRESGGLQERLLSRLGSGLIVAIEPPEFQTRVAILMQKAQEERLPLDPDVADFIAKGVYGNVRELEGALNRVVAHADFTGANITLPFVKEALKDFLAQQEKLTTVDSIQRTVAGYYQLKLTDLISQKRSRSVARPRQLAMALSKELTNHSLLEIGAAFGGRDHTTVLHACKKIQTLLAADTPLQQDLLSLRRALAGV